jgi:hypothetical protein
MNTATQNEYQLEAEYKRWEILLSSLKNENAFLIIKLSEAVDGKEDKEFISKAEYFQNEFISKGEHIHDLEKDIKGELQMLYNAKDKMVSIKVLKKHEKLKNEITYLEKNFLRLKTEFDNCVQKD